MSGRYPALFGGVLVAAVAFAAARAGGLSTDAGWTAAVTGLCATWWITEALPIPATSLVPFAAFPVLGVLDHEVVARAYGHYLILLLLGGFMLSKAVEKSGAHRRMAIAMVHVAGGLGRRGLVLGFMVASAAMSMWISNTATVLVLLPVALAVLEHDDSTDMRAPLLLGIAYAGSIGGIGTKIGTPPNAYCVAIYEDETGTPLSFLEWMKWGFAVVVVFVPIAWFSLTRSVRRGALAKLPDPGPWRPPERRVLIVFAITAAAWIFHQAPFGGWSSWLSIEGAGDETVALLAVIALFVLPSGEPEGGRMLDWETASQIPWGLLLLFGGGIAIAAAFKESGLSEAIGRQLVQIRELPQVVVVGAICLSVTFLTEVTSNTATTILLMPILAAAATEAGIEPRVWMVPAAMSASCAFMLPVATAPNAIVFGSGHVPIRRMAAEGIRLNLIGAVVITAVCCTLVD